MKSYTNWEEFFMPAPIFITKLGELMSISAGGEHVIFKENTLKLPKSFGACLQLVNNQVWWSFHNTRKIMNEIKGHFMGVPKKMANIVLTFFQDEVGKAPYKEELESIQLISKNCRDSTQKFNNTFSPAIGLIEKLLQACEKARQGYEDELKDVQNLKADIIRVKPDKEESEQDRRKRRQQLEEAFQKYKTSIPTSSKSVGMCLLQMIKSYVTDSGAAPGPVFTEQDGTELTDKTFLKVKENWEVLRSTLEEEEKKFQITEKQNQELMKTECDIETYETREKELEIVGRILGQGVEALKSMKKQWDNMVPFFQMISSEIESCFREYFDSVKAITNPSTMDPIYTPTFKASNVAQFVYMISKTYVEVSDKYLMPLLEELEEISTKSSKDSFKSEETELAKWCDKAQRNISSLVQKKEEEFKKNLKGQEETIKKDMKAMQPPMNEDKLKAIEGAMQQAMRELRVQ
ncbi:uncharacterized protein LOC117870491 [Trachemys scripta elegans]|uniref:uncharacterized protein LOC117870491 n=1 Tax=Trachemys scripta elegans TaxID=31138 RepID=UPI00155618E1|nr:uncharacterized protein LOC117870491 [Trachemys scripta elegans]